MMSELPEIDLLLGGHDHFYKRDRRRRIVKSGEEWRWISHVTVEVNRDKTLDIGVERYDIDTEITPDPVMQALLWKYHKITVKKYERVIFRYYLVRVMCLCIIIIQSYIYINYLTSGVLAWA